MVKRAGTRGLLIPLSFSADREELLFASPFYLRPRSAGEAGQEPPPPVPGAKGRPPALLTFTEDDFMTAFFRAVGGAAAGYGPLKWPFEKLEPWRDWSEPPQSMLDLAGTPRYPASLARQAPPVGSLAPTPNGLDGELDGDGIPRGAPPWLRKVYLDLHRHFHLVAADLICRRVGYPSVDPDRLLRAGCLVRRVVPDRTRIRYRDFVAGPEGGAWLEILDAELRPLLDGAGDPGEFIAPGTGPAKVAAAYAAAAGRKPVDPSALPVSVFGSPTVQVALMARLKLRAEESLPATLAYDVLTPLPREKAKGKLSLYGYLPIQSPHKELPRPAPADKDAETQAQNLAADLARRTREALAEEWLGAGALDASGGIPVTPALRAKIESLRQELISPDDRFYRLLVETILPDLPLVSQDTVRIRADLTRYTVPALIDGNITAISAPPDAAYRIWQAVHRLWVEALNRLWSRRSNHPWDVDNPETVFTTFVVPGLVSTVARSSGPLFWEKHVLLAHQADFVILLREEMHTQAKALARPLSAAIPGFEHWTSNPAAFPIRESRHHLLLLCGLQHAAALRSELLRRFQSAGNGSAPQPYEPAVTDTVLGVPVASAPPTTLGSISASLTIYLDLERERAGNRWDAANPPLPISDPFPPASSSDRRVRVHRLVAEWERIFSKWEERAQAGGSAYTSMMRDRGLKWTGELAMVTSIDIRELRMAGIHAGEESVAGLLAFPGYRLSADTGAPYSLPDFIQAVAAKWCLPTASGCLAGAEFKWIAKAEARRRRDLKHPRYDERSLYSLQAFAVAADKDHPDCREKLALSPPGEPLAFADPNDLLGQRPARIPMPDLRKLKRDIPRLARTSGAPFTAVESPPDSSYGTGALPADTSVRFGLGMICSFGIPVFTICAMILFQIIFSILSMIPPFAWMLTLKLCLPVPRPEES